ncbi:GMC family oxidoreductase [Paracoccus albus]|uniref:GMC family oxidoreductase n=1 Tax=Paracoccus albus TaxID=3017784 RepID=UPI0022F0848D|nr:GMC family oxidoreductase N-terminal domain-containing protein [Paracoccus albus]WBU62084.1 GMC family oxidoreductase N-terminal domain-containing protein [Paracoccus albus]
MVETKQPSINYDYIIVGGGTAGCILAETLSRSGRHKVLLLEAGGEARSPWIRIPAGFYKLLVNRRYNWGFWSTKEAATNHREIAIPRGKGLGGSTLINGMIYVRGQPQDYDLWAQQGCDGWGWQDVLPYFKSIETWQHEDEDGFRGKSGPMPVAEVVEQNAIGQAFIDAALAQGQRFNPDYNGAEQEGVGWYQVNQRNGERWSANRAWLSPARGRENLTVLTNARVTRVLLDGRRAKGVRAIHRGHQQDFTAGEVILAAGAVQTPHLLEISGVGDAQRLRDLGIDVHHDLAGVGENYIDHFCTRMNWRVSQPVTLNELTRMPRLAGEVMKYATRRKGVLTYGTGLTHGFLRSRPDLDRPDVQFFFMHASYANAAERKLDRFPGMTIGVTQLRPQSRGSIHAVSADLHTQPAIVPNFLDAEEDRRSMVDGMKLARKIIEQAPMDPFRVAELNPGPDCVSDEDWLAFARSNGQTIYHAVGTCRMGNDDMAVLDPSLRVRGMDGLRVIDASAIPEMVSGNTQAAVMMLAAKGADMVLAEAR